MSVAGGGSALRLGMAALVALLVLAALTLRAPADGTTDILIEQATLRDGPRGLVLDVLAEVQLPIAVRQGLDSGVPLDFLVELSLKRLRPWWPDRRARIDDWSYRLVYYELTRHYRLGRRDGEDARNYRSLSGALEGLGELRGLTVGSLPAGERPLQATLTMRLDSRSLPLPLQPLVGRTWRLRADPFVWRVGT